jgi:hypothetical protein
VKHKKLFLTFWKINLDNLPVGTFVQRRLMPDEARLLIEQARQQDSFLCVSSDDLLASYKERKATQHKDLCEVLRRDFEIPLSINEFFGELEHEGKSLHTTNPLNCVQVCDNAQLMVVTCAYAMLDRSDNSGAMDFTIAPDSVEFRLFVGD